MSFWVLLFKIFLLHGGLFFTHHHRHPAPPLVAATTTASWMYLPHDSWLPLRDGKVEAAMGLRCHTLAFSHHLVVAQVSPIQPGRNRPGRISGGRYPWGPSHRLATLTKDFKPVFFSIKPTEKNYASYFIEETPLATTASRFLNLDKY